MLKCGFLSIFIFCCFGFAESSNACTKPSKKQLKSFFGDQADWKHRVANAGVEINFKKPTDSKIFKGSKEAKIKSYCISEGVLKLETSMGNASVTKSRNRLKVTFGGKVATLHKVSSEENSNIARKQFNHAYYQRQPMEQQYRDSTWVGDDVYDFDPETTGVFSEALL